ncbi:MAG: tRNA epoxyqueuosine(34) reductase QueG [Gemmatimonadaceae bacterium]
MTADGAFETRLKAQALGLGFDLAGIARLGTVESAPAFETWLAQGYHGSMAYLRRGAELRQDTTRPEPGMRSAVVVGLDYGGRSPASPIARYARGDDYHRLMWDRLEDLLAWVRAERGTEVRGRAFVDTGPILERDLARRAGLGWFGKNAMLINPKKGSFFFIGSLFLDLELTPDAPFTAEHCGTCTRCLTSCPTDAFTAPGVLDARRCIAYLTIEHRGPIPEDLHAGIGDHLFGCDVCQDVCPWNVRFASAPPTEGPLAPRPPFAGAVPTETLARQFRDQGADAYRESTRGSAMRRARQDGLARNAAIVLTNLGADDDPSSP